MKKLTRIICAVMALIILSACGAKDENRINASASDIADAVKSAVDYSDAYFVGKDDDYGTDLLKYQYGITDETVLAKISDFVITEPDSLSAKTFAVIIFTDDITTDEINAAVNAIWETYVENRMSSLKLYDPDQYAIAEATSIVIYDNAIVVAAFDVNGNTAVLETVEEAGI